MSIHNTIIETKNIDLINFPMDFCETVDGEPEMVYSDAELSFRIYIDKRENGIHSLTVWGDKIALDVGGCRLEIEEGEVSTINGNPNGEWEINTRLESNRCVLAHRIELDWSERRAYVYFK